MSASPQPAFRALSDPTRRHILCLLSDRAMTIAEVADRFDMTRAAVKKHLTVLQEGNLIHVHPRGRERMNALNPEGMRPVRDWLQYFDHFWNQKLTDLQNIIEQEDTPDARNDHRNND